MAIYHLKVKIIGRGSSRSAVGAAAYRAGVKLRNEYDGMTHDYSYRQRGAVGSAAYRAGDILCDENDGGTHDFSVKREIVYSEIMLPEHAPEEFQDRATLWNSAEKIEKQCNSRTAREVEVALPNELTTEQQISLVQDYVTRNFVNEGMCADFSIHSGHKKTKHTDETGQDEPIKPNNPHAHIMLTVRPLNNDGTWGAKSRKAYMLDNRGNRIRLKSGEWKSRKIDATNWNDVETFLKWREDWAVTVNKKFERLGIDERIDHRSLAEQGIDREPTIHIGHSPERKQINDEIIQRNESRAAAVAERASELQENGERSEQNPSIRVQLQEFKSEHQETGVSTGENDNDTQVKQIGSSRRQTASPHMRHLQESSDKRREISFLNYNDKKMEQYAKEIEHRREQIEAAKQERASLGFLQSKKEIDRRIESLTHADQLASESFKRTYGIEPEAAGVEIRQIRAKTDGLTQELDAAHIDEFTEQRERFAVEYHKQRLLAGLRPDGKEILSRIDKPLPTLAKMTSDQFNKVLEAVPPAQAQILMDERKKTMSRTYERTRYL